VLFSHDAAHHSPYSERALAPAWAKRKEIKGYGRIALLGEPSESASLFVFLSTFGNKRARDFFLATPRGPAHWDWINPRKAALFPNQVPDDPGKYPVR